TNRSSKSPPTKSTPKFPRPPPAFCRKLKSLKARPAAEIQSSAPSLRMAKPPQNPRLHQQNPLPLLRRKKKRSLTVAPASLRLSRVRLARARQSRRLLPQLKKNPKKHALRRWFAKSHANTE